MKVENLQFEEAFQKVKGIRHHISPNEGFKTQLRLFQLMENKFDKSNSDYIGIVEKNLKAKEGK